MTRSCEVTKETSCFSVSSFVDGAGVVKTETFHASRHRAYACSSIHKVSQAFGLDVLKGELIERTPLRRHPCAVGTLDEFRKSLNSVPIRT